MFSHPFLEASSPDSETPLVQPEQIDNISCSEYYEVMFCTKRLIRCQVFRKPTKYASNNETVSRFEMYFTPDCHSTQLNFLTRGQKLFSLIHDHTPTAYLLISKPLLTSLVNHRFGFGTTGKEAGLGWMWLCSVSALRDIFPYRLLLLVDWLSFSPSFQETCCEQHSLFSLKKNPFGFNNRLSAISEMMALRKDLCHLYQINAEIISISRIGPPSEVFCVRQICGKSGDGFIHYFAWWNSDI